MKSRHSHLGVILACLGGLLIAEAGWADPTAVPSPEPSASPSPEPSASPSPTPVPSATPVAVAGERVWTLGDVEKLALEQNPDLRSARASYEAVSKTVMQSVSGYLPHVELNAKYEETTLPSPSAGSTALLGLAEPYTAAVVSVKQTVFDFGKVLSQIQASNAESNSAEQDAVAVRNAVMLSAQRAFFNVVAAEKLVDVAEKGVERFAETRRRSEVLVRTGARPAFDLSQANVELAKAQLTLVNAKNDRDLAKIALLNIMGISRQIPFTLKEPPAAPIVPVDRLNPDHLVDLGLKNRPEMKSSDFRLDAARSTMSAEARDYLPTFSAQGYYGKYLPNYPISLRDAWSVGVFASWHIFDGLRTTYRVAELSSRVDQRQAEAEKLRENISAEVTSDVMSLRKAATNLSIAEEALDYAKENLRLARQRYEVSVGTILELLVAETSAANAEATDVVARFGYENALATLKIAVNAPFGIEKTGPSER